MSVILSALGTVLADFSEGAILAAVVYLVSRGMFDAEDERK